MKIKLNRAFRSMRGAVDDFVYRRVKGQTIVGGRPDAPTAPPSPNQLRTRFRFADGADYARTVLNDSALLAPYEAAARAAGENNLFGLIMADFLRGPTVTQVDLGGYDGRIGDPIGIRAQDDFEVTSVHVNITDTVDGHTLEQGSAQKIGSRWVYTGQTALPRTRELLVRVTAKDRPGNEGQETPTWRAP